MKKRMMKKNLKKNREKNRKKRKAGLDEVQILQNAERRSLELAIPKHSQIPVNAEVVKEHEGWVLYLSPNDRSIYLQTTDYHPDPLRLTMENLHNFMTLIKEIK
jgi:L-rhamnose isomerase